MEEITIVGTSVLQLLVAFALLQEVIAIIDITLNDSSHKSYEYVELLGFYIYLHI